MSDNEVEIIYGISYTIPSLPPYNTIPGYGLERRKMVFKKTEIPESFNDLEYDEDGNPIYNAAQTKFVTQELGRIRDGYHFYSLGKIRYITGLHYFYLNYWTLEDGTVPDYRDADRRWFCFQDYCEKKAHIDGIIRTKSRRQGATSQATASLTLDAITIKKALCGIMSKSGQDAKDAFQNMVIPGFRAMPVFLHPRCEDENPKTELVLQERKGKGKVVNQKKGQVYHESLGLGSKIDWRATALNSYDSGRKTKILIDEGGKFPTDVPVNEYWPILRQTLKQGGRRVGFALLPSTSNKMTKGGKGFKVLWDESNHFKHEVTATGLYRYFCPAYDGYAPFIDQHGMSIMDEKPTKYQAEWMKEHYGATDLQCTMSSKEWLRYEKGLIRDDDARNEHTRMYPFDERDAFDFEDIQSPFNTAHLLAQREYLVEKPPVLRRIKFFRTPNGQIDWRDDSTGFWQVLYFPEDHEKNVVHSDMYGRPGPGNKHKYAIGIDPFRNTKATELGSKGAAFVMKKHDDSDPENTGMPIAMYLGRPKLKSIFHDDMLMAAEFYGAELCYESDIDDYIEFLMERGKLQYAKERPKLTIDPNRKRKPLEKEYGTKSADMFSFNVQIECNVFFVEKYCHKIFFIELIDDQLIFDVEDRQSHDLSVAFQIGLTAITVNVRKSITLPKRTPFLKRFNLFNKN